MSQIIHSKELSCCWTFLFLLINPVDDKQKIPPKKSTLYFTRGCSEGCHGYIHINTITYYHR